MFKDIICFLFTYVVCLLFTYIVCLLLKLSDEDTRRVIQQNIPVLIMDQYVS